MVMTNPPNLYWGSSLNSRRLCSLQCRPLPGLSLPYNKKQANREGGIGLMRMIKDELESHYGPGIDSARYQELPHGLGREESRACSP